jgi:hypothetical protein
MTKNLILANPIFIGYWSLGCDLKQARNPEARDQDQGRNRQDIAPRDQDSKRSASRLPRNEAVPHGFQSLPK